MAAQGNIIPTSASSTFPGCALSCATLLQAQSVCFPPYQPVTNQLTYDQCFCTSPILTPFALTADGVCVTECTVEADRVELQVWYRTFCAQVQQGVDPVATTSYQAQQPTSVSRATTTVAATSGTVVVTVTATSNPNAGPAYTSNDPPWIDTHWKWILMLIILIIGLSALAILAVWLKRRYRRKADKTRAALSGLRYDPEKAPSEKALKSGSDLWGPHQMMDATQGYQYDNITPAAPIAPVPSDNNRSSKRGTSSGRGPKDTSLVEVSTLERMDSRPGTRSSRTRPDQLAMNARMIGAADRRSKVGTRVKTRSKRILPRKLERTFLFPGGALTVKTKRSPGDRQVLPIRPELSYQRVKIEQELD